MPHRIRNNIGKFIPKTATPSSSQPSLFFGDCENPSLTIEELENHLGE